MVGMTTPDTTLQGDDPAYRIEHDTMGEVRVPRDALFQAQTQRAIENFPISGTPIEPAVTHALGRIKGAAARVNSQLGVLTPEIAEMLNPDSDVYGKHQIVDIRPIINAIPLKRLAAMEDVASMVAYLASPEAGYVTGQVISVNGGASML